MTGLATGLVIIIIYKSEQWRVEHEKVHKVIAYMYSETCNHCKKYSTHTVDILYFN